MTPKRPSKSFCLLSESQEWVAVTSKSPVPSFSLNACDLLTFLLRCSTAHHQAPCNSCVNLSPGNWWTQGRTAGGINVRPCNELATWHGLVFVKTMQFTVLVFNASLSVKVQGLTSLNFWKNVNRLFQSMDWLECVRAKRKATCFNILLKT